MKNKFTLLAAVTICLLAMAHAEDWPQFRGPGRDGVWNEKGVVAEQIPVKVKLLLAPPGKSR